MMSMAPQNADSESLQVQELPAALSEPRKPGGAGPEPRDETVSEGSIDRIPVRLWVMHGAVMFGREFCYAMETALVTPILLQIGECRLAGLGSGPGPCCPPPATPLPPSCRLLTPGGPGAWGPGGLSECGWCGSAPTGHAASRGDKR